MNVFNLMKRKIKLIYTSKLTYIIISIQILFLILYIIIGNIGNFGMYMKIFEIDIFLWVLCIPFLIIIHMRSIFTIYYNYISRMENKKNMIISDYWVLFFSSIIYLLFIFILPVLFIKVFNANFTNSLFESELGVKYIFSIVRYVLLTVFVQCIVYTLFFLSAKIQKYSNSLPIIPIVLFIIMTLPLEYLMLKNRYVPVLDFTAGRCYTFILENVVKWEAIILHNLHLIVYLIIYFWLLINFISSKMEFIENENNNN